MNQLHALHRVKVYRLEGGPTGVWVDRGTGHISVEYMEVCGGTAVVVLVAAIHT